MDADTPPTTQRVPFPLLLALSAILPAAAGLIYHEALFDIERSRVASAVWTAIGFTLPFWIGTPLVLGVYRIWRRSKIRQSISILIVAVGSAASLAWAGLAESLQARIRDAEFRGRRAQVEAWNQKWREGFELKFTTYRVAAGSTSGTTHVTISGHVRNSTPDRIVGFFATLEAQNRKVKQPVHTGVFFFPLPVVSTASMDFEKSFSLSSDGFIEAKDQLGQEFGLAIGDVFALPASFASRGDTFWAHLETARIFNGVYAIALEDSGPTSESRQAGYKQGKA